MRGQSTVAGAIGLLAALFGGLTNADSPLQPTATSFCSDEAAGGSSTAECDAPPPDAKEAFFSWDLGEDSLLHALFPDLDRLREAWEEYPLLSKVSFAEPSSRRREPLGAIPTLFHNRTVLFEHAKEHNYYAANKEEGNADPLMSLFSVDDAIEVLKHLVATPHGHDYKVMKKVEQNGEEFLGQLQERQYSLDEVTKYFHERGMSIVVNNMQKRWNAVGRFALQMEEELASGEVNANLYLTSQVYLDEESVRENGRMRQGFDAHWDSTDVFIVQLAGGKRWSVANSPVVFLSNRDMKHKPTKEEVAHYAQSNHHFREFTLCPGDVLYIPRGHIHNASTIVFEDLQRKWTDWDDCPNYPEGVAEAEQLAKRIAMPSMHITFGPTSDLTMETLLHYAMHDYFEEVRGAKKNEVVIPSGTCSNPDQTVMIYDVDMQSVLHHALAEVARRHNDCDNPSFGDVATGKEHRKECDNAVLRKMAPLLLLSNTDFVDEEGEIARKRADMTTKLEKSYQKALEVFALHATVPATIGFIDSHLLRPCTYFDCQPKEFHFPGYIRETDAILCPDELSVISEEIEFCAFAAILQDFVDFARGDFANALKRMNQKGKEVRTMDRTSQQAELERVGQGQGGIM